MIFILRIFIRGHPYISWRQIWQFSPPPQDCTKWHFWEGKKCLFCENNSYAKKATLFWAPRSIWHVSELCIFHVFKIVYIISFYQGTNILSFNFGSFVISITYFHNGKGTVERLFFTGDYFLWISLFFNPRKIAK